MMVSRVFLVASGCVIVLCCAELAAQERFDLQVPGAQVRSRAELTPRTLTITDPVGKVSVYARDSDLDSRDGAYVGYLNAQLRQAIRWPIAARGAFQIGSISPGGQITFRESRMRITPRRPAPVTTLRPATPPRAGAATVATHVAATRLSSGDYVAAYIDPAGALQFAVQERERWRLLPARLQRKLVPGAPLALLPDPRSALPRVLTAGRDGALTSVTDGRNLSDIIDARLVPGGQLSIEDVAGRPMLAAVNADGHLLYNRLDSSGTNRHVDTRGRLVPGGGLAMLDQDRILAIDRSGIFRGYRYASGQWLREDPQSIVGRSLAGFAPGGAITSFRVPEPRGTSFRQHLATVDARGRLQVLHEHSGTSRWLTRQIPDATLPPGGPVDAVYSGKLLRVSATLADGGWYEWHASRADRPWTRTLISPGFRRFTPVHFSRHGRPHGFAVDRRGVLVAASLDAASVWHPVVIAPGFDIAPVLLSRQVVPNPPLRPTQVTFTNEHTRELWLLVTDLRAPGDPRRLRIKPQQSVSLELERDAGGKLVETLETLGRAEEFVYELPPQQLYDVSVYELFLQSVAIDRTKKGKGKIEDINWSPKSIGIFPIPPGNLLPEQATIDAHTEAKSQGNPGGVRRLDMSRWKIDNTVPEGLRVP